MAANQSTARSFNKREIIDALLKDGDMSRAGLAKHMGLSKPATAENVERLITQDLVKEIGEGEATSRGGRKPRLLRFNKWYRSIVAIDLSYINPIIAVGNLGGEIVARASLPAENQNASPQERISSVLLVIHRLLRQVGKDAQKLGMIVIASPGIYTNDNKIVHVNPQFRRWTDIGLDKALADEFSTEVMIKNDMSTAALGEYTVGCKGQCNDMAYVSCGMGLGCGLIINGGLYEGKNNAAGEIAYLTDSTSAADSNTIESRMTIDALLLKINNDIKSSAASAYFSKFNNQNPLKFADIVLAVTDGDLYAIEKVKEIGVELGYVLSNINTLLDCETIVLGGEYLVFYNILLPEIEKVVLKNTAIPPTITPSNLADEAGLYGAIVFAKGKIFSSLKL